MSQCLARTGRSGWVMCKRCPPRWVTGLPLSWMTLPVRDGLPLGANPVPSAGLVTHTHTYTCTHTHTHTHTCAHTCAHTHTCAHMCADTDTHTSKHTHRCTHAPTNTYEYTSVCLSYVRAPIEKNDGCNHMCCKKVSVCGALYIIPVYCHSVCTTAHIYSWCIQ